jgi:unsaturated chondroitin disaccharide hydrolase
VRSPGRHALVLLALASALFGATSSAAPNRPADSLDALVARDWAFAATQLAAATRAVPTNRYPKYTGPAGAWVTTDASDWTSGFFPGVLWLLYEKTRDPAWRAKAEAWQAGLAAQQYDTSTHDVGFKIFPSFGNAFRLTGDDAERQVVLTAARSLATRYSPIVGCTKSWDGPTAGDFRVIIDNMMNLELLFWAAQHGGQSDWHDMAVSHALRTSHTNVRPDGSTYQIVNYDPATGAVKDFENLQGYAVDSTWSRGNAWSVYGFTTAYGYTHDERFLETARRSADYFIAHLPSDFVPYWDFALPSNEGQPRDSSAAAVAASGLIELSRLETDPKRAARYLGVAKSILTSLSERYLALGTSNVAILLHGTYHKPDGNFDTGLVWGDYYFLQALLRYQEVAGTPSTATFAPSADTYVAAGSPRASHATNSELAVVAGSKPEYAFMRFVVSELPAGATVVSAKLRLVVTDGSTSGGVFHRLASTVWPETISWTTKPAVGGAQLAKLPRVARGRVVTVDVSAAVRGNGSYAFAITAQDGTGDRLAYASREASAATRPRLVVMYR